MNLNQELLTSLSEEELEALASSALAPAAQERLNKLLQWNQTGELNESDRSELDALLTQIDHLNIIKARARYTLQQHAESSRP